MKDGNSKPGLSRHVVDLVDLNAKIAAVELGVAHNFEEAANWEAKSASQGNEYGLGYLYAKGEGVHQDYVEAAKWYRKAAEHGNDGAQFELGSLYYNGLCGSQSDKEAAE